MNRTKKYLIEVVSVGLLSLIVVSILLFAARKTCQTITYENLVIRREAKLKIHLSEFYSDPNSSIKYPNTSIKYSKPLILSSPKMTDGVIYHSLGAIVDPATSNQTRPLQWQGQYLSPDIYWTHILNEKNNKAIYYDRNLRQFVHCDIKKVSLSNDEPWSKQIIAYAGPNGIAQTSSNNLGQFQGPILKSISSPRGLIVYDKSLTRFFYISFNKKLVVKGSKLDKKDSPQPIQLGTLDKFPFTISGFHWPSPISFQSSKFIPVLLKSGSIDYLNIETLEFIGPAGHLLGIHANDKKIISPDKLFAYRVLPVSENGQPMGLVVATISQVPSGLTIDIFDQNGKLIDRRHDYVDTSKLPGGPALSIAHFLLENLHSPILLLASYFTADSFEAVSSHRAMFLLPNSSVGMFRRDLQARSKASNILTQLFGVLMIISPSILLGIFLSLRVTKDAATLGLPKPIRKYWRFATIAFGLPAYITYRITRPRETLVTCINCGKLRRPDMHLCHQCQNPWHIPELTPPSWRVID